MINIREKIGRAIGEQCARTGGDIGRAIARQVKRGAEARDVEWMRAGYAPACGVTE